MKAITTEYKEMRAMMIEIRSLCLDASKNDYAKILLIFEMTGKVLDKTLISDLRGALK